MREILIHVQHSVRVTWYIVSYASWSRMMKMGINRIVWEKASVPLQERLCSKEIWWKSPLYWERRSRTLPSVIDIVASVRSVNKSNKKMGGLLQFHQRFHPLNYDTFVWIRKLPKSCIEIDNGKQYVLLKRKVSKQKKRSLDRIHAGIHQWNKLVSDI